MNYKLQKQHSLFYREMGFIQLIFNSTIPPAEFLLIKLLLKIFQWKFDPPKFDQYDHKKRVN